MFDSKILESNLAALSADSARLRDLIWSGNFLNVFSDHIVRRWYDAISAGFAVLNLTKLKHKNRENSEKLFQAAHWLRV